MRRGPGNPPWAAELVRAAPEVPSEMRLTAAGARLVHGEPPAAADARADALEETGRALASLRAADLAAAQVRLRAALDAAGRAVAALSGRSR